MLAKKKWISLRRLCTTGQEHYNPQRDHNPQYDHEAFLGEEQAHEFDALTPAESKRRLGLVVNDVLFTCMYSIKLYVQ